MKDIRHRQIVELCIQNLGDKSNALSTLFYTHLFRLKPEMAHILNGGVPMLNRKFNSTLATFKSIKDLETIRAALEGMARRHVRYHAEVEHFPAFKEALLLALAEQLGEDFSVEMHDAWVQVFDEISEIMIAVLQQHPRADAVEAAVTSDTSDLLSDIGGESVITSVHQRFYDAIYEDDFLGPFFHFRAKRLLVAKQTEFMLAAFGGENHYKGEPPAFVHMHMFITKEMSAIRTVYLRKAILDQGLGEDVCRRWLAIDASFHAALEKRKEDECVMRVWGQHPFVVKKPKGYIAP